MHQFDLATQKITQLTFFENTFIAKPTWSLNGKQIFIPTKHQDASTSTIIILSDDGLTLRSREQLFSNMPKQTITQLPALSGGQ